jgi:hypothetical protein
VASFLKAFINGSSKTCDMPSFLGIEKFGRRLTYPHRQMVTEYFQSPSNNPTPSNGDRIFSVTSQWCRSIKSWPKEFDHHLINYHCQMVIKFFRLLKKGVVSFVFVEGFLKTYDTPPFSGNWNVLITIKRVTEMFLIAATLVIENFQSLQGWWLTILVAIRFGNWKNSIPIPCGN